MVFAAANTSGPRAAAGSIHGTFEFVQYVNMYLPMPAVFRSRRCLFYPELATWNTEPIYDREWANCRSLHFLFFFSISASETPMEQDSIHCSQNTRLPPDKTDTISSQSYEPESLRNGKFQLQSRVPGTPMRNRSLGPRMAMFPAVAVRPTANPRSAMMNQAFVTS